jgi:CRP-like cAMP-binding protein
VRRAPRAVGARSAICRRRREIAGPGAVLGEPSLDENATQSVFAEALAESQVCFLSSRRLGPFLQQHPTLGVRMIAALSAELAMARGKARDLVLLGAESRLAALLLQLSGAERGTPGSRALQLGHSRRELAEMIGVSTETAIRLLAKLKRKGVVAVAGRRLTITDIGKLSQVARRSNTGV